MSKVKEEIKEPEFLNSKEEEFCYLYVYGGSEFAGQLVKCYTEIFGGEKKKVYALSRKLLAKVPVQARIKELAADFQSETETIAIKLQISETLKAVMEETSTAQFSDKLGIALSPAPLRAVSVNAAKALMDLYPVKVNQESKGKGEGNGGGIIFNVIVPDLNAKKENQD